MGLFVWVKSLPTSQVLPLTMTVPELEESAVLGEEVCEHNRMAAGPGTGTQVAVSSATHTHLCDSVCSAFSLTLTPAFR